MDYIRYRVAGMTLCFLLLLAIQTASAQSPEIEVVNLDKVPFNNRMVFSRIGSLVSPPTNGVHDQAKLRINNTGTGNLNVTGLTISGPDAGNYAFVNKPAFPLTLTGGSSIDITVRFKAVSNRRIHNANLTITSNDSDEPTSVVQLAGFWQARSEGGVEPSLVDVINTFGYETTMIGPGEILSNNGLIEAIGDEVLSPYWKRANTSQPVRVRQLAAYHMYPSEARIFWHFKGQGTTKVIVAHDSLDAQTVLPRRIGLATPAEATFSPSTGTAGGVFGFKIAAEWSDPTKNNRQVDIENGCLSPNIADCGHRVRFWKARNLEGQIMANTYLVSMDYEGINYDYNDNVYLISNITPEKPELGPFAESNGQVVFEAENFHGKVSRGNHNWVKKDSTGSVGSSMSSYPNLQQFIETGYATTSPELRFKVNFTQTGTYYIWGRAWAKTHEDNSWHVGVDGQQVASADRMEFKVYNQWKWTRATMDNIPASINITTTGVHVINVWMRDDGGYIDRFVLTKNANYTPSGNGPAQSPRSAVSAEYAVEEQELESFNTLALTETPGGFSLEGNFPNPFNPVTQIRYTLPEQMPVRLEVFDMVGRRVAVLVDEVQATGAHEVLFDASNLSSGMYLYRVQAGASVLTGKMILMK